MSPLEMAPIIQYRHHCLDSFWAFGKKTRLNRFGTKMLREPLLKALYKGIV